MLLGAASELFSDDGGFVERSYSGHGGIPSVGDAGGGGRYVALDRGSEGEIRRRWRSVEGGEGRINCGDGGLLDGVEGGGD